jgi:BirA family biotin operon repressor/biotin-[acetyl-CoA-carboxylase] ligase
MARGVPVPGILNQLALAANRGIPLPADPEICGHLELCRSWGLGVQVRDGRAFLPFNSGTLVPVWIENETPRICWDPIVVQGFLETGSTNDEALLRAREGAAGGLVIYAEKQTEGRGRKARRWESPPGVGLYFSIVVRPSQPVSCWPILTLVAGVALAQAVEELPAAQAGGLAVDLKWPNDLMVSDKKAAGILFETTGKPGGSFGAVVGVGINVGPESFPEGLRDRATSLSQAGVIVPRRRLLVRFLSFFQEGFSLFERGEHGKILEQWKCHSRMWDGVPVWVEDGAGSRPAVTCGLTEQGALKIRNEDGSEENLMAADVSVRPRTRGGTES